MLKRAIENAKQYYAFPNCRAAQEEALKELAEGPVPAHLSRWALDFGDRGTPRLLHP